MELKYDDLGIDLNKSYGMDFDAYDVSKLPKLSETDEKKWYSKFYYQGRAKLSRQTTQIIQPGVCMDPAKAVLPGDVDRLTLPGEIEGDLGYCLLPNGVGYGSTHTPMVGISLEMYDWYKRLRMVDELSYKIWYPGSHATELNGVTVEDVGFGISHFYSLGPCDAYNLGFTVLPSQADRDFLCIIGSNSVMTSVEDNGVRPYAASLFHYVRALPGGGLDFRTHFYIGAFCVEGKLVKVQNIEPTILLEMTRRMASHCLYERGHVADFLPELYEKMKDADLSGVDSANSDMAILR